MEPRRVIEKMLSRAGVALNSSNPWDIQIHDEGFHAVILRDGSLGLGEAYMDGLWSCQRVDMLIHRLLTTRVDEDFKRGWRLFFPFLFALLFNPQSRRRVRKVSERHYNLGNDLFLSFLDPYNQYSCAYFNDTEDLDQAQRNKLQLICTKIGLRPQDHVLDIGCGWGGFARYAAEQYGCSVTGINISKEQVEFAKEYCKDLPVRILQCEYRDIEGTFDKVVSVGMFEHVGRKNYHTFMRIVDRVLKDDGIFLLQTIGGNRSRIKCDPWIATYIFPNSMLPSIAQIGKATERLFSMEDWHNLGPHYDKTLMEWHRRFTARRDELDARYTERFKRMMEYYFLSCAGAFRARQIQLWQIVFTKIGARQPPAVRT